MLFPQAIETVYCRMHHDLPETDTESQAMVVVGFAGGHTGICDNSSLAAVSKPRIHAFGTGGTPRYCHHTDEAESERLTAALPLVRADHYLADGREGTLNRYVLLRAASA